MKQTAVEWFFEQLAEVDYGCINKTFLQNNNSLAGHKLRELLEQAKAMEKEQIKDAWDNGWHEHMNPPNTYITSVKYYNQTFKSE